jgi:hypothetical protein
MKSPLDLLTEPRALDELMSALIEVNSRLLDALIASAQRDEQFALPRELRSPFAALNSNQSHEGARCGVLLVDAGFGDLLFWRGRLAAARGQVLTVDPTESLTNSAALVIEHSVLMLAWHIVHSVPILAGVLLGMSEPVMPIFRALRITDLAAITQCRPRGLKPRWSNRPELWSEILLAAQQPPECAGNTRVLRCLQASANESRTLSACVSSG